MLPRGGIDDISPMAPFRHQNPVLFRGTGHFLITIKLQGLSKLLVIDIADPLKEQDREDIGLVVRGIDRPRDNIRRLP